MNIASQTVVSIHYTLTNEAGEVLDSSSGGDPLSYLHGGGGIIPGLERALEGKISGDRMNVVVAPGEAYGEVNSQLVQVVGMDAFAGVEKVEVGMQFQTTGQDGNTMVIRVASIEGDQVTIDANHPLAGETLHFDVEVVAVREATEEEIAHGHVH